MEDADICDSWEQIEDNSKIVEKQFEKLKLKAIGGENYGDEATSSTGRYPSNSQGGDSRIELDSTSSESLRTQYVSPEPKPLSILSRPKCSEIKNLKGNGLVKLNPKVTPVKTLQQREQEYAEARKRILGDVRFEEEEREAELEATMSPAEILRMKINEAMQSEVNSSDQLNSEKSKETPKEVLLEETERAPKDFPVSKLESGHIVRQPRGPDGSAGFNQKR